MKTKKSTYSATIESTIHNLVWYRITKSEHYLDLIPLILGRIDAWIHTVNCQFLDIEDTIVRAVVELKGKYYQYTYIPLLVDDIIVSEIPQPDIEEKLNEFGSDIWKGYESYGPIKDMGNKLRIKNNPSATTLKDDYNEGGYYDDLPF